MPPLAGDGFKLVFMARSEDLEKVAEEVNAVVFWGSVDSDDDLKAVVDLAIGKIWKGGCGSK